MTGGAGTVTALHRTAFLAKRAAAELFSAQPGATPPILLITFTRNLAEALFGSLAQDQDARSQVEITNVDRLAYRIVENAHGARPVIAQNEELAGLWSAAAERAGSFSPSFFRREWNQVILAQDLRTEQDYLACSRATLYRS